jgi:hypothetical protein
VIGSVLVAIAVSAVLTSFTDWFFFAVWMHDRYHRHPEVWRRPRGGPGQGRAIAWSALLSVLTNIGFVVLCAAFGIVELRDALLVAAVVWLAVPVPMLATNWLFLKLDAWLLLPHGIGWLVRLLATAAIVAWCL